MLGYQKRGVIQVIQFYYANGFHIFAKQQFGQVQNLSLSLSGCAISANYFVPPPPQYLSFLICKTEAIPLVEKLLLLFC